MRAVLGSICVSSCIAAAAGAQTMPPSSHYDSTGRFAGAYRCLPSAIVSIEVDAETGRFIPRTHSTADTNLTLNVAEVGIEDFGSMGNANVIGLDLADRYPGSAMRYAISIEDDPLPEINCRRDPGYLGRIAQTGQLTCETPIIRYEFDLNSMTYFTTFYERRAIDRSEVRPDTVTLSYSMAGECRREPQRTRRISPRPRPEGLAPAGGTD